MFFPNEIFHFVLKILVLDSPTRIILSNEIKAMYLLANMQIILHLQINNEVVPHLLIPAHT